MINNIEILLDKIKKQRSIIENIEVNNISNQTTKSEVKIVEINGLGKEYEEFLKDDILYLTKELISRNSSDKSCDESNTAKVKQFNEEEYYYNTEKIINYDRKMWFSNNDSIKFNECIDINLDKNQYYSLLETNNDFMKLPKKDIVKIDKEKQYRFMINAKETGNIATDVFIIAYTKEAKQNVYSTKINRELIIKFDDDIKKIRIALRSKGTGKLCLDNIMIESKKQLGFTDQKNYRKLGFDKINSLKGLKMAAICDEFTYECLKNAVNLITFTPDDWKARLSINRPHILFIESAWHGKNSAWNRKISVNNDIQGKQIKELIDWCKSKEIPTVFWNKEDPVHFDAFIRTAKLCDYIFTTDENRVVDYKKEVSHNNVYSMQFFAQPKVHNPMRLLGGRKKGACFAGSYYANKYVERQKDMLHILNITKETGLTIYDRNYGTTDEQYMFPEEYREFILGKLSSDEVYKAYRGYEYMINVNSVVNSPTMFSRRVFEGLACGTPVISTYSKAIENTFGDIVIMANNERELEKKFKAIDGDRIRFDSIALRGIREVYEKHTIDKRLINICNIIGIKIEDYINEILVVCEIFTEEDYEKVITMYNDQSYKNKTLILINKNKINIPNEFYQVMCIEDALEVGLKYDYIAPISSDNFYGKEYLRDLEIATKYSKGSIINKSSYYKIENDKLILFNKGNDNIYSLEINNNAILLKTNLIKKYGVKAMVNSIQKNNYFDLVAVGERVYSADIYNFVEKCSPKHYKLIKEVMI